MRESERMCDGEVDAVEICWVSRMGEGVAAMLVVLMLMGGGGGLRCGAAAAAVPTTLTFQR